MRKTSEAGTHNSAGPLADAGPYSYDLPFAHGGGQPQPAPRPARKSAGWFRGSCWVIIPISFIAPFLRELTGWRSLDLYVLLYGAATLLEYWSEPRPNQSFLPWALKVVGIWLNCYVGFVTAPESLSGLLPEPLAFGLPAFVVTAALYCVTPVRQDTGSKLPLWQWLLLAAGLAALWGWVGPFLVS